MAIDMNYMGESIFGINRGSSDLYLSGYVRSGGNNFDIVYSGRYSPAPFEVSQFATRYGNKELDRWVEWGGVERIDRFFHFEDLSNVLKKDRAVELFVNFSGRRMWAEEGPLSVPASDIESIVI